jgi:hypothetical protein
LINLLKFMEIGFVIFSFLIIFSVIACIYGILKFLSKGSYIFDVLKDAYLAIIGVGIIVCATFFLINFSEYVIQNMYPNRIFSKNFGFLPTSDVKDLQGRVKFFAEKDFGKVSLKFKADDKTFEKIIEKRLFIQQFRENFRNSTDENLRNLSENPNTQFYVSNDFEGICNEDFNNCKAYLIKNKENEEIYFVW